MSSALCFSPQGEVGGPGQKGSKGDKGELVSFFCFFFNGRCLLTVSFLILERLLMGDPY